MNKLIIEATHNSPEIVLDPENYKFEIGGESRPANAGQFYFPVINWLENYQIECCNQRTKLQISTPIMFFFKFTYYNSTSAKYIVDMLRILQKFEDVKIKWCYHHQDKDMKESGQELSIVIDANFELIPI